MRCPSCGFENPPGFRFCGQCATALKQGLEQGEPSPGERRQLTVMYCDLVGSTQLSARLDPEELREVIRAYQEVCAGLIGRSEGYIAQYQGDGLLVYFGVPQAHEDDPHRAVQTGLEVVEGVRNLNARFPQSGSGPLAVRVGIHTGLVVVVSEIGVGGRLTHTALGEAPNVAARLQGLAEPATVVVTGATARLLHGSFECQDLGLHPLKGVPAPIQVFRVLRERSTETPLDVTLTRELTPLVGRDQEVDLLQTRWAQARDGTGQIVVLIGEPGIGKTRLAHVLKEHVGGERATRLECRCSPYHQNSALYPVIELVERALEFTRDDRPAARLGKLEAALRRYRVSLPEVMPLFAALLSLPVPEHYPPPNLSGGAMRQKTLDAVLDVLQAMTAEGPVLLIVENLHWVDPSTLEVLTLLVDRIPTAPILAVFTARLEFHPPWAARPYLTEITLGRLSRKETETLVDRIARGKPLPSEVLDQLATKTDGIPLFAEELTAMVLESGLVSERENRYELTGPLPLLAIPATLHDSLMARLDRLATVKGVAQLAATLGRTLSFELLTAVSPLEDATLRREMDRLVEAGLLHQSGVPPHATYTFKHALIQEAAYQSLLRSVRQQYHRQIAQVLVEHFPDTIETQPELLAHHYTAAGLNAEAIGYWQRAGERALRRSANIEAIAHLSKGLELLATLPDSPQSAQLELGLQVSLVVPLIATRGYGAPEVQKTCLRARELCRKLGQVPQLFPVLWGLWQFYVVRAEFQTAHELGEQLMRLAGNDTIFLMLAHEALGVSFFFMGELARALDHLERTVALYDHAEHRSLAYSFTQDPDVAGRSYSSLVLWALGFPKQAVQRSREALARAHDLGHPFSQVFAVSLGNWLHLLLREPEATLQPVEAVLRLSREQEFALGVAMATVHRGWALTHQGRGAEGIIELRRGLAGWRATGAKLLEPYYLGLVAEAEGRCGQAQEGLAAVNEALILVNTTGECWFEAELNRIRGELLRVHAGPAQDDAEAAFRRALDIARRQGSKTLELRAAISLNSLQYARGKRREARRLLMETYSWFTEGSDTADLREARRLLA